MKILLVGHGGREHALLDTLRREAPSVDFFITRGNGGTRGLATPIGIATDDLDGLAAWVDANDVDLTIVGPEVPLAAGIADAFARRRRPIFGPTRGAAAIEASKVFAKGLMQRAGVPTAAFATFHDFDAATTFIRKHGAPLVVKASGLAAGKGAIVCDSVPAAIDAAHAMLVAGSFGAAGGEIVVEEFMQGEELSVFALTDGIHAVLMIPSQDHKRLGEGDTGPNTGGMGAYAPVSLASGDLVTVIEDVVFGPTLEALRDAGHPFRGLLYAGLMLTDDGPRVVEFNARFGDPETQAVLPLLASSLLEPVTTIARGGSIAGVRLAFRPAAALTTVLASAGYPASATKGVTIDIPTSLAEDDNLRIYHAGTSISGGRLVTDGGRVLAVTAIAPTLDEAADRSRAAAEAIDFEGKQFRRDIGWRELERARTP
ncbi:MAG: phosphoribosylamine--glycine ligase [Longimicrobiales bacterium]